PTMAARPGSLCRTSISGNRPSGSTGFSSPSATRPASGSFAATTSTATPGASNASPGTRDHQRRGAPPGATGTENMDEAPGVSERIVWQEAAVTAVLAQTDEVKSFFLKPPQWHGFISGQHVDVRLTAPDGYQAQRSYSIGSAPGGDTLELVIE